MARADDTKQSGKVAGIVIDKRGDYMTVKVDGEEEPTKFVIPASDKKLNDSLKSVFNACRVQLTWKKEGDDKQVTSAKRQILKSEGMITGTVVKVYDNFWVEIKPKKGLADAFAPGGNFKDKDFMERLRGLQPGDTVTITYTTDGERHRILQMKKN